MRVGIWDNPVITKEFRGRMRGARAYWLLFGYLLLLSLTLFFAYLSWWDSHSSAMQVNNGTAGFTIGRTFFLTLFTAQAILITLITPALTAGAISIEREQRTFEMLRATTLSPRAIALGKLASSVAFVVLLLTSSLPLVSLCFLLGGVSPGEVFFGYVLLLGDAFLFGVIGLAWSAHAGSTPAATALSYGSVFVWFFATFPFAVPAFSGFRSPNISFEAVNPVGSVFAAVQPELYYRYALAGWIPALILIVTFGLLLLLACVNRLEDDRARQARPLRIATLIFCALLLIFGNGATMSASLSAIFGAMQAGSYGILTLLTLSLAVILAFVPPFVTGEPVWGSRRRLWRGSLPSGLPFALVLTILVIIVLVVSVAISSSGRVLSGTANLAGMPLIPHWWQGILWQMALLLAAVTVGMGGIGLLLSVLLKSRWAPLITLYLLMILALVVPSLSYATLSNQDAQAAWSNPAINTLYLSPWMGIAQISSAGPAMGQAPYGFGATFGTRYPVVRGMIGYGVVPFWMVTALLYGGVGLVCYGIGQSRLKQGIKTT